MRTTVQRHRQQGPGTISLVGLARHWRVSPAGAKAICLAHGVRDTELRPRPTYRWKDIWRAEGAVNVDPLLWDAYREPLLTPKDLAGLFWEQSARALRRDLEARRWPVIELGERTRRVRAVDVADELTIRAGEAPVRRSRLSEPEAAASP